MNLNDVLNNEIFLQSEIDEMIKRVEGTHKSVAGVIVANADGTIFKSTLNDKKETAQNYANIVAEIVGKARMAFKDKDNQNDELNFLKIRTKKVEFIVVPGMSTRQLLYW